MFPDQSMRRTKLPKNGRRRGPIGLWNDNMLQRVTLLASRGLTTKDIAVGLGINLMTFELWTRTNPEFRAAWEKGREIADNNVEKSLYQQATGYSLPDTTILTYKGEVITVPITKYYPPNVTAAIFWLKNRKRTEWADTHKPEIIANMTINKVDMSDFTDEELRLLESIGMKRLTENAGSN